jgi:pimeloyl-ACP methyl ester carboxylesterase
LRTLRRLSIATAFAGAATGLASTARRLVKRRRRIEWFPPSGINHRGALAARVLGSAGRPVVLLHGLTGSNRYWGAAFDALAADSRLVVSDLLGFGASPCPPTGYSGADHAKAVAGCLQELGWADQPAVVGAHSMGFLIALHLAHDYPELVAAIVAFAPPLYANRESAEQRLGALGLMARILALNTPSARRACQWVCDHREAAATLAAYVRPDLPVELARDGVQHTWASYSESLERVILSADAVPLVETATVPVRFLVGALDSVPDLPLLERLAAAYPHVSLDVWPGEDHDLVLTSPGRALAELRGALTSATAGELL